MEENTYLLGEAGAIILRTKNASFPNRITRSEFKNPKFGVVPDKYTFVDFMHDYWGFSKSEAKRKISEGALRINGKKVFENSPMEHGLDFFRMGKKPTLVNWVWFLKDYKYTLFQNILFYITHYGEILLKKLNLIKYPKYYKTEELYASDK